MISGSGRAVFFAPHPDDDVLACGGTISLHVAAGWEVYVVYMTDGRMSHAHVFGIETAPTAAELAAVRRQEAEAAAAILGVARERLVFLGFRDGTLLANRHAAVPSVRAVLRHLDPDDIYYPSEFDQHPDHAATGWIVARARSRRSRAYVYDVSDRPDRGGSLVRVDISSALETKRLALRQHRSQVTALYPSQPSAVLPPSLIQKYLGRQEVFIRVRRAGLWQVRGRVRKAARWLRQVAACLTLAL